MYKYVKRKVELLDEPRLGEELVDVGDQAHLPLVVDLVQCRGDCHVTQALAGEYYP